MAKFMNKVRQYTSEKMGNTDKTELPNDFTDLCHKTDALNEAVGKMIDKTTVMLFPNPAARTRLKVTGKSKKGEGASGYPHAEGELGVSLVECGTKLGEETNIGKALVSAGDACKSLAEAKDALEVELSANFLKPLQDFKNKDLKEVLHHRKKTETRRLDYDFKRRKFQKTPNDPQLEEQVRIAENKFEESKDTAWNQMATILENDTEQVNQLAALVQAQLAFYQNAVDVFNELNTQLQSAIANPISTTYVRPEGGGRAKGSTSGYDSDDEPSSGGGGGGGAPVAAARRGPGAAGGHGNVVRALYDFEAENDNELTFRENDVITVTARLDENWLEGELYGKTGIFPVEYVDTKGLRM